MHREDLRMKKFVKDERELKERLIREENEKKMEKEELMISKCLKNIENTIFKENLDIGIDNFVKGHAFPFLSIEDTLKQTMNFLIGEGVEAIVMQEWTIAEEIRLKIKEEQDKIEQVKIDAEKKKRDREEKIQKSKEL